MVRAPHRSERNTACPTPANSTKRAWGSRSAAGLAVLGGVVGSYCPASTRTGAFVLAFVGFEAGSRHSAHTALSTFTVNRRDLSGKVASSWHWTAW